MEGCVLPGPGVKVGKVDVLVLELLLVFCFSE